MANITTNKQDYAPGETVEITLVDVTIGAIYTFHIADQSADPGDDGIANDHGTFTAVDGGAGDLDGLADGKITTTWTVPTDGSANNATLDLSATDADGNVVATTTFTDAAGSFSKPYAHWSDEPLPGDWNNNILNDNKSNYFEGEVIPHVFMYGASNNAQLVNGQSYSFNVTYNYYQQNTDAGGFAYMTQYNLSRQPNVFNWANTGQNDPGITPTADSAFTNGNGMAAGASFYTVDADITNVSAATYTGTGTEDGHVTITFTYTGQTTSNGYAAIYYGLYVAKPGEVPDQGAGNTNGANAWTGGSLQTTVDIGGSGATSIQLAPSAIIAGEISGLKFNDLNGNGTKDTGEPGLAGWTIVLDSDSNPSNGNLGTVQTANGTTDDLDGNGVIDPVGFYYFSVTPDAIKATTANDPYYVYEVNQAGWTQTTTTPGSILITAADPTETNVNFGNQQQQPSISLTKDAVFSDVSGIPSVGDTITYTFMVKNTGTVDLTNVTITENSFDLDDPSDSTDGTIPTITVGNLAAGASSTQTYVYTLTQEDLDDIYASSDYKIDNLATAKGLFNLTEVTASDPAEVQLTPASLIAELNVIKDVAGYTDADGSGDVSVGDTINYSYKVESTGTANLTDVTLSDDKLGPLTLSDVAGDGVGLIKAGASETATASYVVQASDLGTSIVNVATADSRQTEPDTDTETVVVNSPALAIEKQILVGSTWVDADTAAGAPNLLSDADGKVDYRFVITNTGTANLTNVVVSDPTIGLSSYAVANLMTPGQEVIIDASNSSLLQRAWSAGSQANTAAADSVQTSPVSDPAYYFGANPQITINKVTVYGAQQGDELSGVLAGQPISWKYEVKLDPAGNVPLSNVQVSDNILGDIDAKANTVLTKTGGDQDSVLESGETWTYVLTGIAQAGSYSNTGTATGDYTDSAGHTGTDSASDSSSYFGTADVGQITPTGTTCDQYVNGTAQDFSTFYASQGGVIQYGTNKGLINATNPGVFFYYTGLSNTIQGTSPLTVKIDQSNNGLTNTTTAVGNTEWNFNAVTNDVKLYRVIDANNNGKIDSNETCTQVNSGVSTTFGSGVDKGDVLLTFTPVAGSLYVIGVKYDTGTVVGLPQGSKPTVQYTFNTNVGVNGSVEETDSKGITLAPKSALTLDGQAREGGHASALKEAAMQHVIDQAIAYWAAQGASEEGLQALKSAEIDIADLGGNTLAETGWDGITIDDDAAGYGWSLSGVNGQVNPNKVDLLSAVEHEFGHLLGHDHNDMGATLGVGERVEPITLVGVQDYQSEVMFG